MSAAAVIYAIAEKARRDVYAESFLQSDGKLAYRPVHGEITDELVERHCTTGPYLGVYFLTPGTSDCSIAAIDLDDKKGDAGPDRMRELSLSLYRALSSAGFAPFLERSGSGTGLHVWLLFEKPQPAGRVRSLLLNVVGRLGLKEGTGSVAKGEVEIFPKQASVPEGSYGNLIALPYNRKSCVLTPTFDPVPEHVLGQIRKKLSRDITDKDCEKAEVGKERKKGRKEKDKETPPSFDEVRQCLDVIPNEDLEYDEWLQVLYAVYNATDGSEEGYEAFLAWSMKSDKHDQDTCDKVWTHCREREDDGVTWRTLLHLAKENGWTRFGEIFRDFVFVSNQDAFYHVSQSLVMNVGAMQRTYAHLHQDMGNFLLTNPKFEKVNTLTYWPGQPYIVTEQGERKLNRWRDPCIEAKEGDVTLMLTHFEKLIPNEMERNHVLNFLAHMIQFPDKKIRHSLVIQGRQGTGKSFLGFLMAVLLGQKNVRSISNQALKTDFNSWVCNVSLVVIEELMMKGRMEIMNNLKTTISQDFVRVNEKNEKEYDMPNRVNFLIFTNHEDALILEPGDRRYFVYFSPMAPEHEDYYTALFEWTEANAAYLKHYFMNRDISAFRSSAPPPMTEAKKKLLQISRTNEQIVLERLINMEPRHQLLANDVVDISAVVRAVKQDGENFEEKQVEKALRLMGCENFEGGKWIIRDVAKWREAGDEATNKEYHKKNAVGKPRDVGPPAKEAF